MAARTISSEAVLRAEKTMEAALKRMRVLVRKKVAAKSQLRKFTA
jgi:hypothetical protein